MQKRLQEIGYFTAEATGFFGQQTKQSLQAFLLDIGLDDTSDELTERAAAFLTAAVERKNAKSPVALGVTAQSGKQAIASTQRTLRFLGYYRGRTNGVYDERLAKAITEFQKAEGLVTTGQEVWAGTIGPKTQGRITFYWKKKLLALRAERLIARQRISKHIREKGIAVSRFLSPGDANTDVRMLQKFLASAGFLPADRQTGTFGKETRKALIAYQVSAGIIKSETDKGAGNVGPATLAKIRTDQETILYRLVRAQGWGVL
jgi:peptidoglycan hydrolase-like protein with peptidoglycan-binding domain